MKQIQSIYVREIGKVRKATPIGHDIVARKFIDSIEAITYDADRNVYTQGNTEYKGEHVISVTYE
jgi:hypothetical protein